MGIDYLKRDITWTIYFRMDRFVKRLSEDEFNDQRKAKRPRLKQATISSLKVLKIFY